MMFLVKKQNLKIVTIFIAIFYFAMPVLLLQHMVSMASMVGFSDECPHIVGGHSMCPMDVAGHYSVWQQFSLSVPKYIFILILPLFALFIYTVLYYIKSLAFQILYVKRQKYRHIRILMQELFAKGILNTKLYYL
ncbi:MAG: hypothetical protein ACR2IQ_01795 [Minisyncoccia bacterium]